MDVLSSDVSLAVRDSEESPPKKKRKRSKTLYGIEGRPKVLTFAERVQAWHDHALGADIFDLSIKFKTTPKIIQDALDFAAGELDYPHNHIDPELERFKIVVASDQMKSALLKCVTESGTTLKQIVSALRSIEGDGNLDLLKGPDLAAYTSLLAAKQSETKNLILLLAEYRATNLVIADLTGIKRTKVERKPKKILTPEERLEGLSTEELIALAEK